MRSPYYQAKFKADAEQAGEAAKIYVRLGFETHARLRAIEAVQAAVQYQRAVAAEEEQDAN